MVYWNSSDITSAIIGGSLIGLAATINLYYNGKITGLSGIFKSVLKWDESSGLNWKLSFLAGLFFIPYLSQKCDFTSMTINGNVVEFYDSEAAFASGLHFVGYAFAGLLVGFGVTMGSGCTSGHGVCGIPRLSKRSIVAVLTFCTSAIFMANLRYYVGFLQNGSTASEDFTQGYGWFTDAVFAAFALMGLMNVVKGLSRDEKHEKLECVFALISGIIFGAGLLLSGMLRRTKVMGFLTINENWDPTLAFVMISSVLVNLITFHFILKGGKTAFDQDLDLPKNTLVDPFLVGGSAVFGLGWGFAGLCPGPALIDFFSFYQVAIWLPFYIIGAIVADPVKKYITFRMAAGAYSKLI